jgi:hypothetical protein
MSFYLYLFKHAITRSLRNNLSLRGVLPQKDDVAISIYSLSLT